MDSSSSSNNTNDMTQTTTFGEASPEEKALRARFAGLDDLQMRALTSRLDSLSGTGSPFTMNLQDQQAFDTSFNAAEKRMATQGKDYADFLSGSRGLRMSDTPISQQAMDRYGLGMADLQGQRATQGLGLGLAANQYRNNATMDLAKALPSAGVLGLSGTMGERLASPTLHTYGYGNTSGSAQQPGMQTGAQAAQGIGAMMAAFAAMA